MSYEQPAPDGAVFAPDAFDGQIGQEIRVNLPNGDATTGRVLRAEVAKNGQSVEITLDADIDLPMPPVGTGSFGLA